MRPAKRAIPRCWPASLGVRRNFLPPERYTHRPASSAKIVLLRAYQSAQAMVRSASSNPMHLLVDTTILLPARAEDLLRVLMIWAGPARRRNDTQLTKLDKCGQNLSAVAHAVALLTTALNNVPRVGHDITLADALSALSAAREAATPLPL